LSTFAVGAARPEFVRSLLLLVAGSLVAFGCASGPKASESIATTEPYRIGPSDKLTIRVLPEPALVLEHLQVRPDGRISVELIGDVQVAGRTTDEVAAEIAEKMVQYRQSPSVSVSVEAPASTTVSVMGEVKSPGSFALDRDVRLSESVALAGGQTELSATSRVRIVRREASGTVLYLANLDRIKAGDGSTDMMLSKGDLVVVPAAYTVVAGYEIRKFLYPLEAFFRTVGSSFLILSILQ
jgi:polysaccharide biosynthesis/export protein